MVNSASKKQMGKDLMCVARFGDGVCRMKKYTLKRYKAVLESLDALKLCFYSFSGA